MFFFRRACSAGDRDRAGDRAGEGSASRYGLRQDLPSGRTVSTYAGDADGEWELEADAGARDSDDADWTAPEGSSRMGRQMAALAGAQDVGESSHKLTLKSAAE